MISLGENILLAFIGFSSGVVVSGGIFAFIAAIGVIERLAEKTHTARYIRIYEEAVIFGGIAGCVNMFWDYSVKWGAFLSVLYCFAVGVFIGTLAVSLAEVLDVVPVFMRRARLKYGLSIFITSLALGKTIGSLAYFLIDGFYK